MFDKEITDLIMKPLDAARLLADGTLSFGSNSIVLLADSVRS